MADESYLIEFIRVGNQVKVTACDTGTGTEVSVIVPVGLPQKDASDLAVRKLRHMLKKRRKEEEEGDNA